MQKKLCIPASGKYEADSAYKGVTPGVTGTGQNLNPIQIIIPPSKLKKKQMSYQERINSLPTSLKLFNYN